MKTNIQIYLVGDEDICVYSAYDVTFNPFKVNDVISLSVEKFDQHRRDNQNWKPEFIKQLIESNDERRRLFHLKKVKLVSEGLYLDTETDKLTIEYRCEFILK